MQGACRGHSAGLPGLGLAQVSRCSLHLASPLRRFRAGREQNESLEIDF